MGGDLPALVVVDAANVMALGAGRLRGGIAPARPAEVRDALGDVAAAGLPAWSPVPGSWTELARVRVRRRSGSSAPTGDTRWLCVREPGSAGRGDDADRGRAMRRALGQAARRSTRPAGRGGRDRAWTILVGRWPRARAALALAATRVSRARAPGNPGMAPVARPSGRPVDGRGRRPRRAPRRRPRRGRPRGAAGRRRRRRRARRRDRLLRPVRRGRPARGLQGVRQGGHGRRRRADRAGARLHDARGGRGRARRVRPAVRREGRRARRRQGRRRHRRPATRRSPTRPAATRVVVEEYLDGPEVSLFGDHRRHHGRTRCCRRRTSSGSSTATQGPNTGGMGAYTPLPWAPAGLVDEVLGTVLQPTVDELRRPGHAVRRAAVRRPRADLARRRGSSSSTPGSATPRPSRCWRCSTPRSARCCSAAATGSLADVRAAALAATARRSPW